MCGHIGVHKICPILETVNWESEILLLYCWIWGHLQALGDLLRDLVAFGGLG